MLSVKSQFRTCRNSCHTCNPLQASLSVLLLRVSEVRLFPLSEDGNTGFAVTLIPRSESTPHMAKAGDANFKYYKRSGDSFYPMEHYDLADMFGRRPHPKLEFVLFEVKVEPRALARNEIIGWQATAIVGLRNTGRGIARYPFLQIRVEQPFQIDRHGLDGNGRFGLTKLVQAGTGYFEASFSGASDLVIYPNIDHRIAKLNCSHNSAKPPDFAVHYAITCEGSNLQAGEMYLSSDDLCRYHLTET